MLKIQLVHDAGGWHAEIWHRVSGKTVYQTRNYLSEETALLAARAWLATQRQRRTQSKARES